MLLHLTDLSNEPLHRQLSRQLRLKILSGELAEGTELPSVRHLARAERLSAVSVERAYGELEADGLVIAGDAGAPRVAPVGADRRRELDQHRLLDSLRDRRRALEELELARDIQCRLLPPAAVAGEGFAVFSRNQPARFVAGDFYDVIRHADGSVGVVVADVAGKGLGPSLLMASVKAIMPFIAAERGVEETLAELNRRLARDLARREFVALAYARFEPASGRLVIANAGLPDPYRLAPERPPRPLVAPEPRLPLGLRSKVAYRSLELTLEPGERLLLLTDGIPEAPDPSGEPLGYERLVALIEDTPSDLDPGDWLDDFLERARGASGPELEDDWTAVLVDFRGGGGPP